VVIDDVEEKEREGQEKNEEELMNFDRFMTFL